MSAPSILILGAAGYIGGTVLTDLLKTYSPSTITALVRSSAQADLLSPTGVTTVVGTLEDIPLLTSLVVKSDVVLNFAVPFGGGDESIQALVDGLELRASQGLVKPVLLQTSGSGTVMYGSDGLAGTDIWRDDDHERWEALPKEAYFHSGNKIVAAAAARGLISAYIILSPTVYGKGAGPGNKLSLQLPAYVRYAKRTGRAAYIGKGANSWGNVHVQDLSALYLLVLSNALSKPSTTIATVGSHGWSNLIYSGLGQHTWGPIISLVGDLMFARGEVTQGGAISIEEGQGDMFMFGGNSFLAVSEKAKAFGWMQKEKGIEGSIQDALPGPGSA